MNDLVFTPIGSSSAGCSYLLSGGGASRPLLIDAGAPFPSIQQAVAFKMTTIAGCLVSHAHGDHVSQVHRLTKSAVDCFGSQETHDHLIKENKYVAFRWQTVGEDAHLRVGPWQVKTFKAEHDMPGTLGFYIASPGNHRFLYLTDSAYCSPRFAGLTHIAIEANFDIDIIKRNVIAGDIDPARYERTIKSHMSIDQCVQMLKANDLSKCEAVYLLHLSDANSNELEFKERVQRATGVPVYIAAKKGGFV